MNVGTKCSTKSNRPGPKLPLLHRITVSIPATTTRVLAQGRDLAPRVHGVKCRCPSPRSGTGYGYFSNFSNFEGHRMPLSEWRVLCLASPERSLGPGLVRLSTSVAGIQQDALQDSSIPSSGCHSDRRITLLPFEGQTE